MNSKEEVFIIFEGNTEYKFLNKLKDTYESKYKLNLINAKSKDEIIKKYKSKIKLYSYSKFFLMYDLDLKNSIEEIIELHKNKFINLDNASFYFVNPDCEFILLLCKSNNPDIYKRNKEMLKYYNISEYRKTNKQLDKIIKQITNNDLNNLMERLKIIDRNSLHIKSSNYYELFCEIFDLNNIK